MYARSLSPLSAKHCQSKISGLLSSKIIAVADISQTCKVRQFITSHTFLPDRERRLASRNRSGSISSHKPYKGFLSNSHLLWIVFDQFLNPLNPGMPYWRHFQMMRLSSASQSVHLRFLSRPEGAAIAGWEQLTIELSAGLAGLRHVLVVLDANGQPISASDHVLYWSEVSKTGQNADTSSGSALHVEFYQETIGGRFEIDGTFRGTRWQTVGEDHRDGSEPKMESTPSEPSAADIAGLKALVAEIIRRQQN